MNYVPRKSNFGKIVVLVSFLILCVSALSLFLMNGDSEKVQITGHDVSEFSDVLLVDEPIAESISEEISSPQVVDDSNSGSDRVIVDESEVMTASELSIMDEPLFVQAVENISTCNFFKLFSAFICKLQGNCGLTALAVKYYR